LLPYLTANAQFLSGERHKVLLAPNAALRWRPQFEQIAPDSRETPAAQAVAGHHPPPDSSEPRHPAVLWVEDGEFVKPMAVTADLTDGTETEVEGPGLAEGQQVIMGMQLASDPADADNAKNPFVPQNPWSRQPPKRSTSK
jgi:hypothetical protein